MLGKSPPSLAEAIEQCELPIRPLPSLRDGRPPPFAPVLLRPQSALVAAGEPRASVCS